MSVQSVSLYLLLTCITYWRTSRCGSSEDLYNGYTILEAWTKTEQETKQLKRILLQSNLQGKEEIWKAAHFPGDNAVIFAKGRTLRRVRKQLEKRGVSVRRNPRDIKKRLMEEYVERAQRNVFTSGNLLEDFTFHEYHNYSEIVDFFEALQSRYPKILSIENIGTSFEGEKILMLKVGKQNSDFESKSIFMESGVHSREWISHAATIYTLSRVVKLFAVQGEETELIKLVQHYDWYFVPVANPDGYMFTWDCDRFWRKTRSMNDKAERQCQSHQYKDNNINCFQCSCVGADINRNFDIGWGSIEINDRSCSQQNECCSTFEGSEPFSESETKALAHFIRNHQKYIHVYLGVHSFSQLWVWPYTFNKSEPPDSLQLQIISKRVTDKMFEVNGSRYRTGPAHQMLYRASGTSMDWVRHETQVPYAFGIELRPNGFNQQYGGFLLPSDQILPTSKELFAGIQELLRCVSDSSTTGPFTSLCLLSIAVLLRFT